MCFETRVCGCRLDLDNQMHLVCEPVNDSVRKVFADLARCGTSVGGPISTLATRLGDPRNIVVAGSRVVWGQEFFDHQILSIDKNPCIQGECVH